MRPRNEGVIAQSLLDLVGQTPLVRVRLDDHGGAQGSITLQGTIGALDRVAKTFVLRGSTVAYGAGGVQFEGGSEADLANGRAVTVKAASHGHDTLLTARRITFN